ncbi:hypothetical protein [Spirosoma validum]|uniref:Uncharacterized protein n=1 Tax=Spirosoma validum TaxID=2771355 RepID=A0A927AZQ0_9BACT|nr:hypothetical protein [Spirosoma validum]MBD2752622.1 hypothetical protein [Spirosoma validum]
MDYSEQDIENLDKIIGALAKTSIGTIPEILYGYQEFPSHGSPEDLDCRTYEDILTKNNICSITDGWTPNSVPGGYKTLYLDSGGRTILRSKKTIRDFFQENDKDENLLVTSISPYKSIGNPVSIEKYEAFDLILSHILTTNQGHSNHIKQNIPAFKDVDQARIDLLLEEMYNVASGAFQKKPFLNRPALFRNNYTHLIKEEGGFKKLLEKREQENKSQQPFISYNFNNSGHGNIINTGNNSFLKATANRSNSVRVSTPETLKDELQKLTTQIKDLLDKIDTLESDTKEEAIHQVEVVERQVAKAEPNFSLIGKALQMIETLLMDAVSNEYTPLILDGIRHLLPQLAK